MSGDVSVQSRTTASGGALRECYRIAVSAPVRRRAVKTSALIGTLLALINYGGELFGGQLSSSQWLRIGLTYLVPYCVATWSSVQTLRDTLRQPHKSQ